MWLGNAVGHAVDPALALAPSDELLQGLAASALAHVFHAGAAKDRAKAQPYRNGGMGDPGPNT
ncbi:MAG: hypothetical protein MUF30_11820 [Burkholderiales bacterium]|nr:hypothetical protein [Burkholderiales bacterium]